MRELIPIGGAVTSAPAFGANGTLYLGCELFTFCALSSTGM